MANTATDKGTEKGHGNASDRMAAARAARSGGKSRTAGLSDREKYALRQIQSARSGLKKAQDGLIAGFAVPAEVLEACGQVSSAVGRMLFD